jgi:hypothetical protein
MTQQFCEFENAPQEFKGQYEEGESDGNAMEQRR